LEREERMPRLTHTCILTRDIDRLRSFYREVLGIDPQYEGDYAEFPTEAGVLSLFALRAYERLAPPGTAEGASNRSVMLEFRVEDVDAEYARLQQARHLAIEWVKPPTTQGWGNRSIYSRDPDGNLVNFYSRVSPT
jgi:catechol 2,3-dioxygenase-like lactoylglutathione lyase family enzyme